MTIFVAKTLSYEIFCLELDTNYSLKLLLVLFFHL